VIERSHIRISDSKNKTKQNKTKQNKTKQNKTKQNINSMSKFLDQLGDDASKIRPRLAGPAKFTLAPTSYALPGASVFTK
jgi:flagellum-specific peptidoglycan hydrolase FlgJ